MSNQSNNCRLSRIGLISIVISAIVFAITLFVFSQALLAIQVIRRAAKANGLVLFYYLVANKNLYKVCIAAIVSLLFLLLSLTTCIVLIRKAQHKNKVSKIPINTINTSRTNIIENCTMRIPGPTPNGGDYSIVHYLDKNHNYVSAEDAEVVIIQEMKKR